ncbi:MAG: hypothetical protein ACI9ZM_002755, partial [Paracoccaceae bacterium]
RGSKMWRGNVRLLRMKCSAIRAQNCIFPAF